MTSERSRINRTSFKTTKHHSWDKSSNPPGITDVLGVVTGGPMDDVSLDSVQMIDEHFRNIKQLSDTVDACNKVLKQNCPDSKPVKNFNDTQFTFSELSFEQIKNKQIRRCLQELPTSFSLDKKAVDLLIVAAAQLLNQSNDFIKGMKALDPSWEPRTVLIPENLVAYAGDPE